MCNSKSHLLPLYMTRGYDLLWPFFLLPGSLAHDVDTEEHFLSDFPVDPIKQGILEGSCSSVGHISMACLGLRLTYSDS